MPNIIIRHNNKLAILKDIKDSLIAAASTYIPHTNIADFMLIFQEHGNLDVYQTDISIEIEMMSGPDNTRIQQADEIAQRINATTQSLLPDKTISVSTWVKVYAGSAYVE